MSRGQGAGVLLQLPRGTGRVFCWCFWLCWSRGCPRLSPETLAAAKSDRANPMAVDSGGARTALGCCPRPDRGPGDAEGGGTRLPLASPGLCSVSQCRCHSQPGAVPCPLSPVAGSLLPSSLPCAWAAGLDLGFVRHEVEERAVGFSTVAAAFSASASSSSSSSSSALPLQQPGMAVTARGRSSCRDSHGSWDRQGRRPPGSDSRQDPASDAPIQPFEEPVSLPLH